MGKTREQKSEIDPRLTDASVRNLNRAEAAQMIPFQPNRGMTIAGFTPQQQAAFGMADDAATAFGFDSAGPYIPPAGETVGGIYGHSSAGHYDDMMRRSVSPFLQDYVNSFFIDPNAPIAGWQGQETGGDPTVMQPVRSEPVEHGSNDPWNTGRPAASSGWSPYSDPYEQAKIDNTVGAANTIMPNIGGGSDNDSGGK